jgi:hypothetical protein
VPLHLKPNALVELNLNDEYYFLTMNDRGIHKLIKFGDALPLDQSPLIFKQYPDFYNLSYKQLTLSCEDDGLTHFIESHSAEQSRLQLC